MANVAKALSERVYESLKRDIIKGHHQPGEALDDKVLAARYKSSRTPVRQAAIKLEQERFIQIVPNRGCFVTDITLRYVNELYEYRALVESGSAEMAARKETDTVALENLAHLATIGFEKSDRVSFEKFVESDSAFHVGIAQLTRNQFIVRAVSELRCQMERLMYAATDIGYYGESPLREHTAILEAIKARDPQLARKEMYDHIMISREKTLGIVNRHSSRI